MPWPTPQEYNEAIQGPALNFRDAELRAGATELTALGLPRPITGNFASVYRIRCGDRDWAVRCFWREYVDMQFRYAAISRRLDASRLPFMTQFEYVPEGIRSGGTWYPILKMEWVEGQLLNEYVEKNLRNAGVLRKLASHWLAMILALEHASVAHGDLQHGNVLIARDKLKLVDYDGMFVPELVGRTGYELGHQNYQHPSRTAAEFGIEVDRFSSWVIYLSLLAVAAYPELWKEAKGGDECLILRKPDFEHPDRSMILSRLLSCDDRQVRETAEQFRSLLDVDAGSVPRLGEVGRTEEHRLVPDNGFALLRGAWRRIAPSTTVVERVEVQPTAPAWLSEHVEVMRAPGLASFTPSVRVPRTILLLSPVLCLVAYIARLSGEHSVLDVAALLAGTITLDFGATLASFRLDHEVRILSHALQRERRARRDVRHCERGIRNLERSNRRAFQKHLAHQRLRSERRQAVDTEFHRLQSSVDRTAASLSAELDRDRRSLQEIEMQARVAALDAVQTRHVLDRLAAARLSRTTCRTVGWFSLMRLRLGGIRTAADVTLDHVAVLKRLDTVTVREIVAWRVSVEREARSALPRTLPPESRDPLLKRFGLHRNRVDRLGKAIRLRSLALRKRFDVQMRNEIAALDRQDMQDESEYQELVQKINLQMNATRAQLPPANVALSRAGHDIQALGAISFGAYLRMVVSMRRSALFPSNAPK